MTSQTQEHLKYDLTLQEELKVAHEVIEIQSNKIKELTNKLNLITKVIEGDYED